MTPEENDLLCRVEGSAPIGQIMRRHWIAACLSEEVAAPDGKPVHVFLVLVAPPWDDRLYLKFYREAADLFLREGALETLLAAKIESDVLEFFRKPDEHGTTER